MANFIRIKSTYINIDLITSLCIEKHSDSKYDMLLLWTDEEAAPFRFSRSDYPNIDEILAVIIHSK